MASVEGLFVALRRRMRQYLDRRAHRSFRLTKRRDIPKRIKIDGYFSFTKYVIKTLWQYRTTFLLLTMIHILLTSVFVGVIQQENYAGFSDVLATFGPDLLEGNFGTISQLSAQFGAIVTGGLSNELTPLEQSALAMINLMAWLVVVWLLRQLLAGNSVKLRDGLYNAGAPIVATICVFVVALLQLLPGALGIVAYAAAYGVGALTGGVEAMLFGLAALLLVILSLYWVTSTILAGVIVTLPGTYPMSAIRAGGDMAFGRRTALLKRLLWLGLALLILWAVVLIPIILLDNAVNKGWMPIVPVTVQLLTALSAVFATSYIYLLYRKLIDGDTAS